MSRRDTIIVAVLINAGLLVVLFVSALKSSSPVYASSPELTNQMTTAINPAPLTPKLEKQNVQKYAVETPKKELPKVALTTPKPNVHKKVIRKEKPQNELKTVTITKGDMLEKIARKHGVSVNAIMELNQLSNSRLKIGQVLKIPAKKSKKSPINKNNETNAEYYVVKGGDNPWTIAVKNNIKVEDLLRLNKMDEEKAKKLRPGDKLRIK